MLVLRYYLIPKMKKKPLSYAAVIIWDRDEVNNSNSLNNLYVELISWWIWRKCIMGNLSQVAQMCELTCVGNTT